MKSSGTVKGVFLVSLLPCSDCLNDRHLPEIVYLSYSSSKNNDSKEGESDCLA
jgi:hypothetical protein